MAIEDKNIVLHKRSVDKGKVPTGSTLSFGEIAVNFNSEDPFLSFRVAENGSNTDSTEYIKIKPLTESNIKELGFVKNGDIQILEFANTEDTPSIINFGKLITIENEQITTSGIGGNENTVSIMSLGVDEETNLANSMSQSVYTSESIMQICGKGQDIWNEGAESMSILTQGSNYINMTCHNAADDDYVVIDISTENGVQIIGKTYIDGIGDNTKDVATVINDKADKSDIATPDWNAQEGEAGYIENKPFGDIINHSFDSSNFTKINDYELNSGIYVEDDVYIKHFKGVDPDFGEDYEIIKIVYNDIKDGYYLETLPVDFYINEDNYIIFKYVDGNDDYVYEDLVNYIEEHFKYKYDYETGAGAIKPIDTAYIPDTVLKTTPQTLPDSYKNQALANLGIPFVSGDGENSAVLKGGNNRANGVGSISLGIGSTADGKYSFAVGNSVASGDYSHSEGVAAVENGVTRYTKAIGKASHAEGEGCHASATGAHAEGMWTDARKNGSHAEGYKTVADGQYSHAEGNESQTIGNISHAEGKNCIANGRASHAEGWYTITNNEGEHASGKYNVSNTDTQFSIGIGTAENKRKNAFEATKNGDIYIEGVGGYDGTNPNDSKDVATTLTTLDERVYKIESNIASESEIDDAILGILDDINLVSENDINKLLNSSF